MSKKVFKVLTVLLASVCTLIFSFVYYFDLNYPDRVYTSDRSNVTIGRCTVDFDIDSLSVSADSSSNRSVMKLFGIIPIKNVSVCIAPERSVVVCASPFGVMLYSQGVMVVGSNGFEAENGMVDPAKSAGIKTGDIIISINDKPMTCIEDVTKQVSNSNGQPLSVELKRDDERLTTTVTPLLGKDDGRYHIGIWVRDSSAGIGTVTFYDPEYNVAVGFGHPICDTDTGDIVEISNGTAVNAGLYSVRKGSKGNPGELLGTLKINSPLGDVIKNENSGVYFECNLQPQGVLMPVAYSCEIETGPAQVYTTVDGEGAQCYDVQIESIDPSKTTKNMVVKITDPALIEKTGGIVQGMSGSPILQNGKLIGAVTHVLVDDPTRGYGIFAENMLDAAA